MIDWPDIQRDDVPADDGAEVEIAGWMAPIEPAAAHSYFLLTAEQICCFGCLPQDPLACVEVFATLPIPPQAGPVRLAGRWRRLVDDPAGWRFQLREARLLGLAETDADGRRVSRRTMLVAGAALSLAACAAAPREATTPPPTGPGGAGQGPDDAARLEMARRLIAASVSVDIHSHAGRVIAGRSESGPRPFQPLAAPMREGGMSAICLAIVADTPTTHVVTDTMTGSRRITAYRTPAAGELYAWSREAFARLDDLLAREKLPVVASAGELEATRHGGPAIIVSSEGADFLEGVVDRVDEAHANHRLRHLQLTHYRVNELGDIQTEAPVHDGLTDFGVAVIQRCNKLGVVVDVAHGTYDLVKRAAAATTRPLILSHTSLSERPGRRSREISPDHARVIAATGGVIGIWPPATRFPDMDAFARGMARMVDVVGVDHVGLGSDMLGLLVPSVFDSYSKLPELASALLGAGFHEDETAKILGGNYQRVFAATIA